MTIKALRRRSNLLFIGTALIGVAFFTWGAYRRAHLADLDSRLVDEAGRGHLASVAHLLDAGADPNASKDLRLRLPQTLLEHLKMLFYHDDGKHHTSALQAGIGSRNLEIAKLLLRKGATDVNGIDPARSYKNAHLIHAAVREGDAELVNALLDKGADINSRDWIKDTPLQYSIIDRQAGIMKLLLKRGADPNSVSEQNRTPLQYAAQCSRPADIECLIDAGAQVNKRCQAGSSALGWAVLTGKTGAVKCLIAHGADVNMPGLRGYSPLDIARRKHFKEIAGMLERAGAKAQPSQDRLIAKQR